MVWDLPNQDDMTSLGNESRNYKPSNLPMITSRVGGTIDQVIMVLAGGPPKKTSFPDFF